MEYEVTFIRVPFESGGFVCCLEILGRGRRQGATKPQHLTRLKEWQGQITGAQKLAVSNDKAVTIRVLNYITSEASYIRDNVT